MHRACLLIGLLVSVAVVHAQTHLDAAADERLNKSTAVYAAGKPLGALLTELSAQSGVKLIADRAIAEHRAILVAEGKPLHEVLSRLAEAFDFDWSKRDGSGGAEYTLYQKGDLRRADEQYARDMRALSQDLLRAMAGQALARASKVGFDEMLAEAKQMRVDTAKEGVAVSPEQAKRLLLDKAMGFLTSWEDWVAAATFARLSPPDLARLKAGEPLAFSTAAQNTPVPPDTLEMWRKRNSAVMSVRAVDSSGAEVQIPEIARQGIREQEERAQAVQEIIVVLYQSPDTGQVTYTIGPPEQPGNRVMARFISRDISIGGGIADLFDTDHALNPADWKLAEMIWRMTKKESKEIDDERILSRVTDANPAIKIDPLNRAAILTADAAKKAKVCLAAEYYPLYSPDDATNPPDMLGTLKAALNYLTEKRYRSQLKGDWAIVQYEERPFARLHDVSQERFAKWFYTKDGVKRQQTLDDLGEIAHLTEPQIHALAERQNALSMPTAASGDGTFTFSSRIAMPALMGIGSLMDLKEDPATRAAYRLYGSLSAMQKDALQKGEAVAVKILTPQQQRQFAWAMQLGAAMKGQPPVEADANTVANTARIELKLEQPRVRMALVASETGQEPVSKDMEFQSKIARLTLTVGDRSISARPVTLEKKDLSDGGM